MIPHLIALALLLASPNTQDAAQAVPSAPILQISLGEDVADSDFSVLDFQNVAAHSSAQSELVVKNVTERTILLDAFSVGDNLKAEWQNSERTDGLRTRTEVGPGESRHLEVAVLFDDSPTQQLIFMVQGHLVQTLGVTFQQVQMTYCQSVAQNYLRSPTGNGDSKKYNFELGKALPGYELDPNHDVQFCVKSEPEYNHQRGCHRGWTHCDRKQEDNDNVWYTVSIQGHHDGSKSPPENSSIVVHGILSAYYRLKTPPTPRLISREEVERQASSPKQAPSGIGLSLPATCPAYREVQADCLVAGR